MEEVDNLLVKLGEMPDRTSNANNLRVINMPDGVDRDEFSPFEDALAARLAKPFANARSPGDSSCK